MIKPNILLGGHLFGYSLDRYETYNLLSNAYLNGVYGIDTGGVYSSGISEQIIGEWASTQGVGRTIRIISKLEVNKNSLSSDINYYFNSQLKLSLIRLKISSIDTLLLHHFVDDIEFLNLTLKFFQDSIASGLVQNWGICNINLEQFSLVAKIMNTIGLKRITIQNYCNWAKRKHDYWKGFFDIANAQGIELEALSYGIYGRGVLVSLDPQNSSQENVGKSRNTLNEIILQEKTDPLVHKILREVNDFLPISQYRLERFALSFVLSQNTGAIVGIRSLDQLTRAISSYAQPYSHTIMFKILEKINSELKNLKVGLGDPGLGG